MRSKAVLSVVVLALSGCALIKSGTSQMILFNSKPEGAEVWLNGKKHPQLTPTTIDLPKDEVTFQFKKDGFATHSEALKFRTCSWFYWSLLFGIITGGIDWASGAWKEFDVPEDGIVRELRLAGDTEEDVYISSNPVGASIRIGTSELQEKTGTKARPAKVTVKWGDARYDREKQIILKYPDYQDATLRLRRGDRAIHKELDPKPEEVATLFESEPANAEVLINGIQKISRTPGTVNLEWFTYPTQYEVEFRLFGYKPWRKTIKSKAESAKVVATLEEIENPVLVKIECTPPGSAIEVDGSHVGDAPAELNLIWSVNRKSHRLKLSRPGYESKELTIDESQKSATISVRLVPSLPRLP